MLSKKAHSSRKPRLKRKAFFIDERALRRAKRALGLTSDAEAVRTAIERTAEMEEFWRFMKTTRGILTPGSIEEP